MMNETPILTIAIPTYNRKMLLRRALDSIFCQNNPNLEVLVSDNASNDGTDELLKEYSKIYTNLRFVVNDTNIGSMNNFLNCLKRASGKYIILLGSDDLVLPDSIQHIISFLTNNDNMSLVFLNHCGFYDEFISEEKCSKSFLENKCSDIVTHDKSLFLEHAKVQLTFMSALILNKSLINLEDKIQEYSETHFLHTCLALDSVKEDSVLGIIFKNCIAQDLTPSNATVNVYGVGSYFRIFGEYLEKVYLVYAANAKFDYDQLENLYINYVRKSFCGYILNLYINKVPGWYNVFSANGKDVVMKHKKLKYVVMPVALILKITPYTIGIKFINFLKFLKNKIL